ncbi:MAG: peptidase M64 N-terminal domain-containing protein, partial [Acidobacteriota bacterium]
MKILLSILQVLVFACAAFAAPATMRLDYYHTGTATEEVFSVDRIVIEPLPWPGDLSKAIDDTNLGKYLFEVRDQKTKRLLYSRGFASIYGEWETTDEAKSLRRTFSESLRFPAPESAAEVVLKKRDAKNDWRDVWSTTIDPKSIFVDRSKTAPPAPVIAIQKMGDPATKVDFLILGDGGDGRAGCCDCPRDGFGNSNEPGG